MSQIIIYKGRSKTLAVGLRIDVSNDHITSELRAGRSSVSPLLATWEVTNRTDGTDGELLLHLDDETTSTLTRGVAYMDLKRVSGGEPLPGWEGDPLQVVIKDVVTA